jgi:hypothetical protein
MWLADIFNVELTKIETVEKEKIVYKIIPAEGKIVGDVIIEGDVEVQGGLYVTGGLYAGTYLAAKEGIGEIETNSRWEQKFDGTTDTSVNN